VRINLVSQNIQLLIQWPGGNPARSLLTGPNNPDCYATDSDYNPFANDRQHTSAHQYAKIILYPAIHFEVCC
jgi:hypothetical protein